jgi:hypothetical protein
VHWVEVRDWEKAFHTVIPKRKFQAKTITQAEVADAEEDSDSELGPAPEGSTAHL